MNFGQWVWLTELVKIIYIDIMLHLHALSILEKMCGKREQRKKNTFAPCC